MTTRLTSIYIHASGSNVTARARPHGDAIEQRNAAPTFDATIMQPGEDAPTPDGFRLAFVDRHGAWRLPGSGRLVAVAP